MYAVIFVVIKKKYFLIYRKKLKHLSNITSDTIVSALEATKSFKGHVEEEQNDDAFKQSRLPSTTEGYLELSSINLPSFCAGKYHFTDCGLVVTLTFKSNHLRFSLIFSIP